jgi:hypothetical protein
MKKKLVASLAAAMILGVAGTSFAASNPFVDVPANNWAYSSVSKLAQAGIIDGYGDGTFRGDKTITRYEMAQIVAKAIANEDKANAEQKAEIKKLQAEYSDELDKLGVRVGTLEKNQPNLKFGGTANIRYRATDYDAALKPSDVNAYYRVRLNASAKVDDKTTFGMRFVNTAPDKASFGNNTWSKFGDDSTNGKFDRVFITTKIGVVDTTIGRQAFAFDPYSIVVDSAAFSFDGVQLATKLGQANVTLNHGRFAKGLTDVSLIGQAANATYPGSPAIVGFAPEYANMDINSLNVSSKIGNLNYGLGYLTIKNSPKDIDLAKYYLGTATYNFTKKFSLGAEYAKDDEADKDGDLWAVKAIIGDQALKAKGNNNLTLQYSDLGANSVFNRITTLDTPGDVFDNYKVLDANYNYAFSKNMNAQLQWVKVDDKDNSKLTYNYYKATLNVAF